MPPPSPGPAVTLESVTKRYGVVTAVDGVSLTIAGGSFVALVGSSGSGKSTLLKTINRLIAPDQGVVRIDGEDVAAEEPHVLRRRIGYVFQNIGLFPHMDDLSGPSHEPTEAERLGEAQADALEAAVDPR